MWAPATPVKALNNLMSAAHLLVSSEALIAGQRFGRRPPPSCWKSSTAQAGRSTSTENKWPNYILTGKYDAGFALRLMVKDIRLALAIEHAAGVPATASEAVAAAWESALADLPPDADHTAIARWLATRFRAVALPRPRAGRQFPVSQACPRFLTSRL